MPNLFFYEEILFIKPHKAGLSEAESRSAYPDLFERLYDLFVFFLK